MNSTRTGEMRTPRAGNPIGSSQVSLRRFGSIPDEEMEPHRLSHGLDVDFGAGLFELLLEVVGFGLFGFFLDGLGRTFNEGFGFG